MIKEIRSKFVKKPNGDYIHVSILGCRTKELPIIYRVKFGETEIACFGRLGLALMEYDRIINVLEKEKNGKI